MPRDSDKTVHKLGVIGAGTMGAGIALLGLRAKMAVSLYDISQEMLDKGAHYIKTQIPNNPAQFSRLHASFSMQVSSNANGYLLPPIGRSP